MKNQILKGEKNIKINKIDYESKIGEENTNSYGSIMKIIKFNNQRDITVQFDNGYIVQKTRYDQFCRGGISNPYDKSIFGLGYIGEGKYKPSINGKHTKQYIRWHKMMQRCYGNENRPTYKDVFVCDEWHCFQNFAKWYDENYYEIDGENIELDKDILFKGNKIYSLETCVFVPQCINLLFRHADRGECPIGVEKDKRKNIIKHYRVVFFQFVKYYLTPEEAFESYKEHKEMYIKEVADKYKKYIPEKLYNAMYNYQVEITD